MLGIELRIDWSLLFIFLLIVFQLGASVFPRWHPDWSALSIWIVSTSAALLFLGSVLVHEMAHALVARAHGLPVNRITLFLFGGMAHLEREPRTPLEEFSIAIVGPLTSFSIGAVAIVLGMVAVPEVAWDPAGSEAMLAAAGPIATLLLWLGPVNVVLAIFNVLPGFPLDGGRVLRSIIWSITKDLTKASRWAAGAGQILAYALMGFGVFTLTTGALMQGLWLILIGWFLNNAARASHQSVVATALLSDVPVRALMQTHVDHVEPELSVEGLVREHLIHGEQQLFPVAAEGRMLGVVSLDDIRDVPRARWAITPVRQITRPVQSLETLSPTEDARSAFEQLSRSPRQELAVVDAGEVVGLFRRSDVLRWIAFST